MIFFLAERCAVLLLKEDVVILVAFERRVEINQIDRLIGYISPQDVKVITIVKKIVSHRGFLSTAVL